MQSNYPNDDIKIIAQCVMLSVCMAAIVFLGVVAGSYVVGHVVVKELRRQQIVEQSLCDQYGAEINQHAGHEVCATPNG